MAKYKIKITYDTGSTFQQEHGVERILDIEFDTIEEAEDAVRDIEAHYETYLNMDKFGALHMSEKEKRKMYKEAFAKPWFYVDGEERKQDDYWRWQILLGKERKSVHVFWCGYFENLVGAEVVVESYKYERGW